jgi:hypothetical protein
MFVRWQKLPNRSERDVFGRASTANARLTAILVKSMRVNGKPRQQHIAVLGRITERQRESVFGRFWFWRKIKKSLDLLQHEAIISPTDRPKIEASIAKRVRKIKQRQSEACIRTLKKIGDPYLLEQLNR